MCPGGDQDTSSAVGSQVLKVCQVGRCTMSGILRITVCSSRLQDCWCGLAPVCVTRIKTTHIPLEARLATTLTFYAPAEADMDDVYTSRKAKAGLAKVNKVLPNYTRLDTTTH